MAVEHAVDSIPLIMSRSLLCGGGGGAENYDRSTGGKTAVARTTAARALKNATFTVRTPFGSRAGREEGLLAWLHIPRGDKSEQAAAGEAAPAAAPATAAAGEAQASTMESSIAERPDTVAAAAGSRKQPNGGTTIHGAPSLRPSCKDSPSASPRARGGSDAAIHSSPAPTQACLWLEDRTARARLRLLAAPRPSSPTGATGAAGCAHASARVINVAAGPELAEVVSGAGRHSDDCDGGSQRGGQKGCDQDHAGDAGVSADDTLALVRKYAVCTEVVVLGPAGSPRSTKAPAKTAAPKDPLSLAEASSSEPPAATTAKSSVREGGVPRSTSSSEKTASPSPTHSSASGGGGASSYPRDGFLPPRTTSSPGDTAEGAMYTMPCETVRAVNGVRVLMRSYLVVEAKDVSFLPRWSNGKNSRTSSSESSITSGGGKRAGGIERNKRDEETKQKRHCLDYANAAVGMNLMVKHQHHQQLNGATSGADEQSASTGITTKQKERDSSPRPLVPRILSVSEAVIVQLAGGGVPSSATDSSGGVGDRRGRRRGGGGGGGRGGPKLASRHERESMVVRGLLRDVGFRTVADGGVDGRRRQKVLSAAATAVKGQGQGTKGLWKGTREG